MQQRRKKDDHVDRRLVQIQTYKNGQLTDKMRPDDRPRDEPKMVFLICQKGLTNRNLIPSRNIKEEGEEGNEISIFKNLSNQLITYLI